MNVATPLGALGCFLISLGAPAYAQALATAAIEYTKLYADPRLKDPKGPVRGAHTGGRRGGRGGGGGDGGGGGGAYGVAQGRGSDSGQSQKPGMLNRLAREPSAVTASRCSVAQVVSRAVWAGKVAELSPVTVYTHRGTPVVRSGEGRACAGTQGTVCNKRGDVAAVVLYNEL